MTLPLALDLADDHGEIAAEEFELDLRVVESTTPIVAMMCSTSDGCGNTCSTSACSSSSYDPF